MSDSLDAIVGSFPDFPDCQDPFTERAKEIDRTRDRFAHLDRVLRECAASDDPIYRTAAALWDAVSGPANAALTGGVAAPSNGVEIVKERKDGEMSCECLTWATLDMRHQLLTGHHERCPHSPDALTAAYELIAEMARGMECWAGDEDGAIHPDAWKAYRRAKALQGKFLPVDPD